MKTFLKRVYFQIAAPLWRKFIVHLDDLSAAERASRNEIISEALQLKLEVQSLRKLIEDQVAYIADLRRAGLHDLLSSYSDKELKRPETVVSALADVVNGMEPSTASVLHGVPADEINSWLELFLCQIATNLRFRSANTFNHIDRVIAAENASEIELLECQLEFNAKSSQDREHADSMQIARLSEELRLERHHVGRVVNGQ